MDRQKTDGKERPLEMRHQAAMELLYDMALETAMRLREMYGLTLDQVSLERRTIFLERTKNGNQRQVPLSTVPVQRIQEYMQPSRTAHATWSGSSSTVAGCSRGGTAS